MKIRILLALALLLLGAAAFSVMAQESAPAASPSPAASSAPSAEAKKPLPMACPADPAAIEEFQKVRERMDARLKELAAREAELKARERAIEDELKKLETLRDEVVKVDNTKKKEREENVAKIIETIETMSPKASSTMLSGLNETLAVAVMSRLDTPKLAKIMNAMDSKKASRLTEILAGVTRARAGSASSGAEAVTRPLTADTSSKGGE